jgi:hypothetical protein
MDTQANRRQFERLELTERAIAVDPTGRELGPVKLVGGGGMLVCECGSDALKNLRQGVQMRVTIVEPDLGTTNVMDVEIRYISGTSVGMQFITLK